MKQIFLKECKMNLTSTLYWCGGMILLIAIGKAEFSTCVSADSSMMTMLFSMPRIVRVMFGMDSIPINTPLGYFACMLLWYQLVAFFHAASIGSGILAKEERDHTADYLLTKPYSRSRIMTGKILASLVQLVILNVITWGPSLVVFGKTSGYDTIYSQINEIMLGMLLIQVLYFAIGLLLSTLNLSPKTSSGLSMMVVLVGYILSVFVEYEKVGALWDVVSPFRYFPTAQVADSGIRLMFVCLTLLFTGVCLVLAYRIYNRKDIQA